MIPRISVHSSTAGWITWITGVIKSASRCASLRLARRSLATPVSKNRFLLRSASLPPQHAQHRRALGTPELRADLRRKEGYLLSLPSIYEPVCAQKPRPHWLDPFASLRASYAGLLSLQSFAPAGAGSSPV